MPAQVADDTMLRTLGDPVRLRLLRELPAEDTAEVPVGELARRLDLSDTVVSQHLRVLTSLGLVGHRRSGRAAYYYVKAEALVSVRRTLAHELPRMFAAEGALSRLSARNQLVGKVVALHRGEVSTEVGIERPSAPTSPRRPRYSISRAPSGAISASRPPSPRLSARNSSMAAFRAALDAILVVAAWCSGWSDLLRKDHAVLFFQRARTRLGIYPSAEQHCTILGVDCRTYPAGDSLYRLLAAAALVPSADDPPDTVLTKATETVDEARATVLLRVPGLPLC